VVAVEIRYWVLSTVDVTVEGSKTTVVTVGIVLVTVCVSVWLVTVVLRIEVRYWMLWTIEVTVTGIKATVVSVGIMLVEVDVLV
jgi:hypothetical protein